MEKIDFVNNDIPALNARTLNKLQDNIEDAIEEQAFDDITIEHIEVEDLEADTITSKRGNLVVDSIRSKNIFNKNGSNILNGAFINASNNTIGSNANTKCVYTEIKSSTTYTVSKTKGNRFAIGFSSTLPALNVSLTGVIDNSSATSLTGTSDANSQYLVVYVYNSGADTETFEDIIATLQIEESSTPTAYTPFQELNAVGIVESYHGANDSYIKFADGTMIVTKYANIGPFAINTASGSMFISAEIPLGDWITPFTAKPYYCVSQSSGTSFGCIYYLTGASATSAGKIQLIRTTSHNSANWACSIIAIGRWK